jgi:hypothetical protein
MIATTTRLNTPGPELAAMDGVHALTDVTGFGLAGHALELARGAKLGQDEIVETARAHAVEIGIGIPADFAHQLVRYGRGPQDIRMQHQ